MMRPISNRNGLVRDSITLNYFRCRICSKAKYSNENNILLILPVK